MAEHRTLPVWRCARCGRADSALFSRCPGCGGDAIDAASDPGYGTLVSWTIIRRPPPAFLALRTYAGFFQSLLNAYQLSSIGQTNAEMIQFAFVAPAIGFQR